MGDAKHRVMRVSVVFKKRDGNQFLEFKGPGKPAKLSHTINLGTPLPVRDVSQREEGSSSEEVSISMELQSTFLSDEIC
jgi:hypothetical protein